VNLAQNSSATANSPLKHAHSVVQPTSEMFLWRGQNQVVDRSPSILFKQSPETSFKRVISDRLTCEHYGHRIAAAAQRWSK
jgi:hypothetical protein